MPIKLLTQKKVQDIYDTYFEKLNDPEFLAKDYYAVMALKAILEEIPNYEIRFCGGTSLSDAYKIIYRMSEDVDLKIVFIASMAKPLRDKQRRKVAQKIKEILGSVKAENGKTVYYDIEDGEDGTNVSRIMAKYPKTFHSSNIEPRIKIELGDFTPILPAVNLDIQSLISLKLSRIDIERVSCVDLTETVIDKMIALPRRIYHTYNTNFYDDEVIRHIYDIFQIIQSGKINEKILKETYWKSVLKESNERAVSTEWDENPSKCIKKALQFLKSKNCQEDFVKYSKRFYLEPEKYSKMLKCVSEKITGLLEE